MIGNSVTRLPSSLTQPSGQKISTEIQRLCFTKYKRNLWYFNNGSAAKWIHLCNLKLKVSVSVNWTICLLYLLKHQDIILSLLLKLTTCNISTLKCFKPALFLFVLHWVLYFNYPKCFQQFSHPDWFIQGTAASHFSIYHKMLNTLPRLWSFLPVRFFSLMFFFNREIKNKSRNPKLFYETVKLLLMFSLFWLKDL